MIYMKIYELYEMGFSKSAISKRLGISRITVAKYLKNTSEEFEKYLKKETRSLSGNYSWLVEELS